MESNNQIAVAKAHGEEGKKNVDKAKLIIERARESLKVSWFAECSLEGGWEV
jgi:hypothetical protein